ncbi:hypothetical protein ACFQQB_44640 [Nonomuraea rubra]|uniref:hypothetical protein n=1 Tax=Nonomuraea rubra TaxID=46180 RepID=UPI00360A44FD
MQETGLAQQFHIERVYMAATNPPKPLLDKAAEAVARFGKSAAIKLNGGGQPEDQLRAPLEQLFEDIAAVLGVDVAMIGEMSLATLGVRPDYAVDVAGARVGYVELKAPGRGVPTTWTPNKHEKTQWEKLRLLPNVLYTDGALWALYRDGELVGQVARLNGDVRTAGSKLAPFDGEFARVVSDFLLWKPNPLATSASSFALWPGCASYCARKCSKPSAVSCGAKRSKRSSPSSPWTGANCCSPASPMRNSPTRTRKR